MSKEEESNFRKQLKQLNPPYKKTSQYEAYLRGEIKNCHPTEKYQNCEWDTKKKEEEER